RITKLLNQERLQRVALAQQGRDHGLAGRARQEGANCTVHVPPEIARQALAPRLRPSGGDAESDGDLLSLGRTARDERPLRDPLHGGAVTTSGEVDAAPAQPCPGRLEGPHS